MSNQKIIKAIAGIAAAGMMATCLPVAAFAATGDTYHFSFSNGSSQDLAPGGSMTFPASQYDYGYWITLQGHGGYTYNYYPGDTLPYDAVDQWFTADGITSCYAAEGNPRSITINYQIDGNTVLTETDTATFPGSVDGQSVEAWTTDSGDTYTASSKSLNHDRLFYFLGDDIHDNVLTLKATTASTPDDGKDDNKGDDKGDVTNPDDKGDNKGDNTGDSGTTTPDDKGDVVALDKDNTGKDNTSTGSNKGNGTTTTTPTAPRKNVEVSEHGEIAAAIANGTWGNEYTVCTGCGYHNWTRKGNVYVCDHCGHEVLTVKGADGVKGYAGTLAGNEPQYASTSEAQAAAEKREAAYAASIAALQAQVAAREAAYAASLGIH